MIGECTGCRRWFTGDDAFDTHRTGTHEYLFSEGLAMNPPREDGRRCRDEAEMVEAGLERDDPERLLRLFARAPGEWAYVDPQSAVALGLWRKKLTEADQARLAALREAPRNVAGFAQEPLRGGKEA